MLRWRKRFPAKKKKEKILLKSFHVTGFLFRSSWCPREGRLYLAQALHSRSTGHRTGKMSQPFPEKSEKVCRMFSFVNTFVFPVGDDHAGPCLAPTNSEVVECLLRPAYKRYLLAPICPVLPVVSRVGLLSLLEFMWESCWSIVMKRMG